MDAQTAGRFARSDWLELGVRLLCAEGPPGLGLDWLTEAAGRTKGSFYHHFRSREDFLAALAAHWRDTVVEPAGRPYRDDPSPAAWRALLLDAPFQLNQPFERALRRLAVSEPVVSAAVDRVDRERIDSLTFLVSQLRDDFEDPRAFAVLMYAVIVGAQWLLRSPHDPRAPALREMIETLFLLTPPA
jgi:AcrR family transcriptional regulator